MAYKKEELIEKALKAIKKHNLIYVHEVITFLPCSRQTFYTKELDKYEPIKEGLEQNRVNTKVKLRKNWEDADSAAKQIALYRLLATDLERKYLNQDKEASVDPNNRINIIIENKNKKLSDHD